MTHGRPRPVFLIRPLPVVSLSLLALFLALTALPAAARPAPMSDVTVTLLSVGAGALQVQGSDGRAFALTLTPATWVLQRGLAALPRDLTPGETLRVRRGRGKGGRETALLVCDAETADALDAHRRRPLSGTVVRADGRVWTVQPADSALPLPVCLSPRTTFRAGGAPVAASAFGAGAAVTITTRGLASGLLSAVSVSEARSEEAAEVGNGGDTEAPAARRGSASGVVTEMRADEGLLTLQDGAGALRTVAVDARTRVKTGGRPAARGDLRPGMRVRVWWGAAQDAAGNPVATTVSASAGKATTPKRKRR
jgi:hypothetical protein